MYSIKNDLFVEYFIWCLVKKNKKDGNVNVESLKHQINSTTLKHHLKDNVFFNYNNGRIYLKSLKTLDVSIGRKNYFFSEDDLQKLKKDSTDKKWTKTAIKYFFIVLVSCKYADKKPYGISLIANDTNTSESTVYRAMSNNSYISRHCDKQAKPSPRSHRSSHGDVNYTANFNHLLLGTLTYNRAG